MVPPLISPALFPVGHGRRWLSNSQTWWLFRGKIPILPLPCQCHGDGKLSGVPWHFS